MSYQIVLIFFTFSYFVYARNIIVNENVNFSSCLVKVTEHILKNNVYEANYEYQHSIITTDDYISRIQTLQVNVFRQNESLDYNRMFNNYGYDKKFLVLFESGIRNTNVKKLLFEGWIRKRAKITIVNFKNGDATLITNKDLVDVNTKLCTKHFYEKHTNFCSSSVVTNHYLSKNYLNRLCEVKVSWVRASPFVIDIQKNVNPGLFVSFFKLYGETRSININFQKDNGEYQDEFLSNGTFFKLRKGLSDRKYDAAIGLLFMNWTKGVPFNYGPLIFQDSYYFTMKKRERITSYKKLSIVFKTDVWTAFLVTFLLVAISYFLLSCVIETHGLGFTSAVFSVFSLSLSCGVSVLPQSLSLRLLFIFYSLYSLNMDSAYLGTLSQIFTNAPYDVMEVEFSELLSKGINANFNWLAERLCKINFVARRNFQSLLRGGGHMVRLESDEELLKRVAYSQENMTFTLFSTLVSHPYDTSLVENVVMPHAYLTLFVTFYIRNDFHLKDSLQFWSYEVFEKGFFSKWFNDIIEQNRNGSFVVKDKKEAIALKVQHFEEVFKILLFGYVVATAVLILEFFYAWIDRRFAVTNKIIFVFSLLKPPPMNQ